MVRGSGKFVNLDEATPASARANTNLAAYQEVLNVTGMGHLKALYCYSNFDNIPSQFDLRITIDGTVVLTIDATLEVQPYVMVSNINDVPTETQKNLSIIPNWPYWESLLIEHAARGAGGQLVYTEVLYTNM